MVTAGFSTKVAVVSFTTAVAIEAGSNISFSKNRNPDPYARSGQKK